MKSILFPNRFMCLKSSDQVVWHGYQSFQEPRALTSLTNSPAHPTLIVAAEKKIKNKNP